MCARLWGSIYGDTFSLRSRFSSSSLSSLVPPAFYSRFYHSVTLHLGTLSVHLLPLHQYQQCQLPHPCLMLTRPASAVTLVVSHASLPNSQFLEASRHSVADHDVAAGTSGATRSASYQLQQYTICPRCNDPYVPGHGDHRVAARLAELDAALSLLQKSKNTSRL